MSTMAESERVQKPAGPPKRSLKNYLLDPTFQLKYTGMVIGVTLTLATILGGFAYKESKGQTESLKTTMVINATSLDSQAMDMILRQADERDRNVLASIIFGVALLTVALGITGVIVTHKVVGPAYKLKLLLRQVGEGKLKLFGHLRKGDELQDVFEEFASMIQSLRKTQAEEIADLDAAIAKCRADGVSEEDLVPIQRVRDRMQAALD